MHANLDVYREQQKKNMLKSDSNQNESELLLFIQSFIFSVVDFNEKLNAKRKFHFRLNKINKKFPYRSQMSHKILPYLSRWIYELNQNIPQKS